MPVNEEENKAIFSPLNETNDRYQLYFKNRKEKVENKITYLLIFLCIHIDIYNTDVFLELERIQCLFK